MRLIEVDEYGKLILDFIGSDDYKRILESMNNVTDEFQHGFTQGLCWAYILASRLSKYEIKLPTE